MLIVAGFEVLTAVTMKSSIFWYITPCCSVKVNQRFGVTYRFHLQGRRIRQAIDQHELGRKQSMIHAGFLLGLHFDPEYEFNMFHRNVGGRGLSPLAYRNLTYHLDCLINCSADAEG
jgi:hypothetical protein